MDYDKEKADNLFISIIGFLLFVFLLLAIIGFYLGSVVYFFFPYKLAVGLFFAGFSVLLIIIASASRSGYLVISILATIFLSGSFMFFPSSEITVTSVEMMEDTRVAIQQGIDESDGSFKVVLEQVKDIPVRMYKGFLYKYCGHDICNI